MTKFETYQKQIEGLHRLSVLFQVLATREFLREEEPDASEAEMFNVTRTQLEEAVPERLKEILSETSPLPVDPADVFSEAWDLGIELMAARVVEESMQCLLEDRDVTMEPIYRGELMEAIESHLYGVDPERCIYEEANEMVQDFPIKPTPKGYSAVLLTTDPNEPKLVEFMEKREISRTRIEGSPSLPFEEYEYWCENGDYLRWMIESFWGTWMLCRVKEAR